jgi:hypothetical protein
VILHCSHAVLPLQYQAVKHTSPTRSGIDILPFMLSVVAGSIIAGIAVQMTGYYWYATYPYPEQYKGDAIC